ncbi:response regulator [bacterium]|nr:response regulator [bacterium]
MKQERLKLLMIESDPIDARIIEDLLKQSKPVIFETKWTDKLATGLEELKEEDYDVILLNLRLPDSKGLNALNLLMSVVRDIPIVILTDVVDESLAITAMKKGVQDYLIKGQFYNEWLNNTLRTAIKRKRFANWLDRKKIVYPNYK